MKGFLHKTEQGWVVEYAKHSELPLHPDDVKQINRDAQLFDNIEARIAAYPNVEFEILIEEETSEYYAKLILSKEQQKQLITEDSDYPTSQIIAKPFFLLGVPKDTDERTFNYLEKYCYEKYTDYNTFIYFSNDTNYEFKLLK
jgi:hypothetical protein